MPYFEFRGQTLQASVLPLTSDECLMWMAYCNLFTGYGESAVHALNNLKLNMEMTRLTPLQYRILESDPEKKYDWAN